MNMPVYDSTKPEDIAALLMTLPTNTLHGKASVRRSVAGRLMKEKGAEFMASVKIIMEGAKCE